MIGGDKYDMAGAVPTKNPGEIGRELEILSNNLEGLLKSASNLRNILNPVLRPEPTTATGIGQPGLKSPTNTHHGNQLSNANGAVLNVQTVIEDLIQRLEV